MSIRISLETTLEGFCALKDEWNDLTTKVNYPEIFYRWEWAWLCYRHFRQGSKLLILAVRDGRHLVGLAPFCIHTARRLCRSVRVVETIVTDLADYRNVLIREDQHRRRIVRVMLEWLHAHRSQWDVLDLNQLSSRDATTFHLATVGAEFAHLKCIIRIAARTPRLAYANYPTKSNKKQIKWLKARMSRLKEEGFKLNVGVQASDELWAAFVKLHQARWGDGPLQNKSGAAFYDELRCSLGEHGLLECSYIAFEGKPVAMHFGFRDERKIYFYMPVMDSDFREHRVGAVLSHAIVEHYARSHQEFDFLRGDEDYKYWWTDDVAVNFRVLLFYRTNLNGLLYNTVPATREFLAWLAFPGLILQGYKSLVGRLR